MKKLQYVDEKMVQEVANRIQQSEVWDSDDVNVLLRLAAREDERFELLLNRALGDEYFEGWERLIEKAAGILGVEIY